MPVARPPHWTQNRYADVGDGCASFLFFARAPSITSRAVRKEQHGDHGRVRVPFWKREGLKLKPLLVTINILCSHIYHICPYWMEKMTIVDSVVVGLTTLKWAIDPYAFTAIPRSLPLPAPGNLPYW